MIVPAANKALAEYYAQVERRLEKWVESGIALSRIRNIVIANCSECGGSGITFRTVTISGENPSSVTSVTSCSRCPGYIVDHPYYLHNESCTCLRCMKPRVEQAQPVRIVADTTPVVVPPVIHTLAEDARLIARFIIGWWPGLEDGIEWGKEDVRPTRSRIYRAARRILKNKYEA